MNAPISSRNTDRRIPAGIWALGFVSMLMDVSSEMIHALLPVYLVTALGASVITVGLIEGVAEATASITKVFSGALHQLGVRAGDALHLAIAAGHGATVYTLDRQLADAAPKLGVAAKLI